MDTIENKVQQLQKLSQEQKSISGYKKDIADILGNANMEEKVEIAKKMSKTQAVNEDQELNLGFIVPHIVKENYGPAMELKINKQNTKSEIEKPTPIAEQVEETIVEPTIETKIEKKQVVVEPIVENFEQEPKPKEKTESEQKENNKNEKVETEKANEGAGKVFVVPGFDIQKPVIETEKTKEEPAEQVVEPIIEEAENTETENSKSKKTDTPYAAKSMTGYLNKDIHEATDENRGLTFKIGDPVTLINYGGERKYCGKITGFFREENKDENETPKECFIFTERGNKESNKRPVYIGSFEKATPKEIRTGFGIQKLRNTIRPKNTEEKIQIQEEKVKKIAEEKALLQKKIDEAEKNQKK